MSFIFILVKLDLKKFSSTYTVHIYNVYLSFTESITEVFILGYTEVDILCALSLHAVVLWAVEVRDYHEELAGREFLINAAVPCILKAQFQLCGDG